MCINMYYLHVVMVNIDYHLHRVSNYLGDKPLGIPESHCHYLVGFWVCL